MTTAFVLSGGGSLGAVQVGMLQALADRHITPDLVVGSSVGALNAAYLAGHPGKRGIDELAVIWSRLTRHDVFPTSIARAGRALAGQTNALADPQPLRELLTAHLPYPRLQDAPWPVAIVGTEVLTGREVVMRAGPTIEAVMASAALPAVFPPVEVDDHLLIDGGVANNTPISVAISLGATRIYVLPTGYACALARPPRSALGMALHAVTLTVQRRMIDDVDRYAADVDLRVAPPLCPLAISPVDFRHSRALAERARASTRRWLDTPPSNPPGAHLALHEHRPDEREHATDEDANDSRPATSP